jgi:hypothetical protein
VNHHSERATTEHSSREHAPNGESGVNDDLRVDTAKGPLEQNREANGVAHTGGQRRPATPKHNHFNSRKRAKSVEGVRQIRRNDGDMRGVPKPCSERLRKIPSQLARIDNRYFRKHVTLQSPRNRRDAPRQQPRQNTLRSWGERLEASRQARTAGTHHTQPGVQRDQRETSRTRRSAVRLP